MAFLDKNGHPEKEVPSRFSLGITPPSDFPVIRFDERALDPYGMPSLFSIPATAPQIDLDRPRTSPDITLPLTFDLM